MKEKTINKLTAFIAKNKKSSEKDLKIYKYGLEALYNIITKTIVILLVTFYIKTIKECLLILAFYTLLRLFAYGIHASSSLACWITTLPIYIGGSILIKHIIITKYITLIIWIVYTTFVFLWAPADTQKRPLIRKERRKKLKIESLIICFSYLLIIIFINNYLVLNAIAFGMTLEGICICPLTYKIAGHRFNNYIYYNQEHGLN